MFITAAEVMTRMQIETSLETIVSAVLPGAIDQAFKATKNNLHIPGMSVQSWGISFDAAAKTITDSIGNFTGYYLHPNGITPLKFQAGMLIHIEGSVLNDGVYTIESVNDNVITVTSSDTLYDELSGALINITMVKADEGFKNGVAQLCAFFLNTNYGVSSDSIGNYSATYTKLDEALRAFFAGYYRITFK